MPKTTRSSGSNHLRYTPGTLEMPGSIPPSNPQMEYYAPRNQAVQATYYEPMSATASQAAMPVSSYDPYAVAPPLTISTNTRYANALPTQHRTSSGAWSPEDDQRLIRARSQGHNWSTIMENFPGKSANACRKRHERLMERKGVDDWDTIKLERLAKEYMSMRKQLWTPLAQATGEKWNVVEQQCMSNGIKNLQAAARHANRRERTDAGAHVMYEDDSGVSGIGLTPVDDHEIPFSSPSSAGGSARSSNYGSASASIQPGNAYAAGQGGYYMGHHHHPQQQHHHHHGYSNSVSSTVTAGYGNGHGSSGGSHSPSPYLGHGGRLPSVDINTLINRGPPTGHQ